MIKDFCPECGKRLKPGYEQELGKCRACRQKAADECIAAMKR